jgi:pectin methylesterase-like acyl-CoA thioesterase
VRRTSLLSRPALIAASALTLGLTLTACGASTDDAAPAADATTSSTASESAKDDESKAPDAAEDDGVKVVEVTMTGSKVEPAPSRIKVDKGTEMKVVVTRDTDGEIHIHGVDQDVDAKAGEPVTMTFTADQTGIFEAEAHDPDRQLFQLVVS